ncbi:peptidyl-prolyl cis-trans isomerase [Bradyrhizobium sp.]|uniref:peptidylprolyl isomerase n=1 Tax=Bradyrhizobium sp. TaxID=376 RepID=UPI003BAEB3B2
MKFALLREPLLQFLVLGAALFGLFQLVGSNKAETPTRIVISSARIANLADGFARTWQRPPGKDELQSLVDDYIRDEVFYREGRAAGLDRDDVIIRRRVRQKMEFLGEDMSAPEPSEEQLAAHLGANPERFKTEDRLTFRQVFLSATRRAASIDSDSKQLASALARADAAGAATALGDPFLLGEEFHAVSPNDVVSIFGDGFAKRIFVMEQGRWQGPIASSFGQHFVYISERVPGTLPPLDAIREAVRREWSNARRLEAGQKLYSSLRERYEIVVETPPAKSAQVETKP